MAQSKSRSTRPARPRAACSPKSSKARRRRRSTPRSSRPRRTCSAARSRRLRLLHLRGADDQTRQPADARAGPGVDQGAAELAPDSRARFSKFVKDFKKKWKAKTDCRAGYVVADCKQYKAPKTEHRRPAPRRHAAAGTPEPTHRERIERSTPARSSTAGATRRSRSRSRCARARRAAPRCPRAPRRASSRRPSCATAASLGRQGRSRARSPTSTARSRGALAGTRRRRPGAPRPGADRARRHAQQVAARRQRDPRRLARGRPRAGGRGGPAAVALPRRGVRARAAGADDERAQRRRARRQQSRLPGVHGRALRRRELLGVPADGHGGLPRAEGARCTSAASARPSATRAASRRTSAPTRRRWRCSSRGSRPPATPRRGRRDRARPGHQRALRARRLRARARGSHAQPDRAGRLLGRSGRALPDRLDRGRHGRGGLGRLEGADRAPRGAACSWSATTCS